MHEKELGIKLPAMVDVIKPKHSSKHCIVKISDQDSANHYMSDTLSIKFIARGNGMSDQSSNPE